MGNCNLNVKTIKTFIEIYGSKLDIPAYQRNYTWKSKTALTLVNDINSERNRYNSKSFGESIGDDEYNYRLGTIILHGENSEKYNIVDGLQRITTISLIVCKLLDICKIENEELKEMVNNLQNSLSYNSLSFNQLIYNYHKIVNKLSLIDKPDNYLKYLLEHCEVVVIECDNLGESFQFFDSQNSRGKGLEPHDILKAFHLRCCKEDSEMNDCITYWNYMCNLSNKDNNGKSIFNLSLTDLFESFIYPIRKWSIEKTGLYYSIDDIDEFKGVNITDEGITNYNYVKYYKSSCSHDYVYQISKEFIAGINFFKYVKRYYDLLVTIENVVNKLDENRFNDLRDSLNLLRNGGRGDKYTIKLWFCVLLIVCDRFNENILGNKKILDFTFKWACAIRLYMPNSVYKETINNYALGKCEINQFNIFNKILLFKDLYELYDLNITLGEKQKDDVKECYMDIYEKFFKEQQ